MKKSLVFVLCFVFLIGFASAAISISEPRSVYNLGDELSLTVTTNPASNYGWFEVNLVCGAEKISLEKTIGRNFVAGEELQRKIKVPLTSHYVENVSGSCYVTAGLGGESIATGNFLVTDDITMIPSLDKGEYEPKEAVILSLEVTKANGYPLNGFAEISGGVAGSMEIVDGVATKSFKVAETIESGNYPIHILVYDKIDGLILNQGNGSISFSIRSIPSFIDISLGDVEVVPGNSFDFGIDLYDQSGKVMNGSVSVVVTSPLGDEIQKSVISGNIESIKFEKNATYGIWMLTSRFEDIIEEREFTVLAVPQIEFDFLDTILVVKSVGNDVYNKTISIDIGGETRELVLRMGIGEERRFNLKAPDGEYDVVVSDGDTSIERSDMVLTGNIVEINDLGTFSFLSNSPIIWILIIAILAAVGGVLYFKFRKKTIKLKDKVKGIAKKLISKKDKGNSSTLTFDEDEGMLDISKSELKDAESSLVLKGEKQRSAVIALKIDNFGKLKDEAKKELLNVMKIVRKDKGMVDLKAGYMIIIFSPLVTRTFDNEVLAAKAGQEILKHLGEYNKKFSDKIEFNLGLNSGDLIASVDKGKLKYTSIGSTILLAKKIADSGKGKLLVPQEFRKKIMRDLKVQRAGTVGKSEVYSVVKVTDREANQEKLKDILKRMKND